MYRGLKDRRRALIVACLFFITMAIVLGHYFETQNVSESTDTVEFLIGVSQANLTEPWRINMNAEIAAEALKYKNVRIIFTNASQNSHKQIRDVDELLQLGIDLLIISPNDSTILTPIVAEAYRKIPVIVMARGVEGYDYTLHIGPDNWLIGNAAGKYIADLLGEAESNVLEIQGPRSSPSVRERSAGFREALGLHPNIRVTDMTVDNWRRDTAEDEVEVTMQLNRQYQIDAVFAHSDYMAVGAYNTVKRLGKDGVKIVGINDFADPSNGFKLVEEGVLQATFSFPSGGKEAVQYALDILKGERGIPKKIITRSHRITRDGVRVNAIAKSTQSRNPGQKLVLGFAQFGVDEKWRSAQSESIRQAAREMGIELKFWDSGSALMVPLSKVQEDQIQAIRSFIAAKVDGIILAPVVDYGWDEVLQEAKAADIPVFIAGSRHIVKTDHSLYAFRIGSDLEEQGRRAARWIVETGRAKRLENIVELEGPEGRAPTIERKKGFADVIDVHPELRVIFAASGNFTKSGGKTSMKSALELYGPRIHAVFAHNDNMALGAIEAIEEYGLIPGQDILIISVDGTQEAFGSMLEGKLNCTIEYTPLIGPQLMQAVKGYMDGRPLPLRIIVSEEVFPVEKAVGEYEKRLY